MVIGEKKKHFVYYGFVKVKLIKNQNGTSDTDA